MVRGLGKLTSLVLLRVVLRISYVLLIAWVMMIIFLNIGMSEITLSSLLLLLVSTLSMFSKNPSRSRFYLYSLTLVVGMALYSYSVVISGYFIVLSSFLVAQLAICLGLVSLIDEADNLHKIHKSTSFVEMAEVLYRLKQGFITIIVSLILSESTVSLGMLIAYVSLPSIYTPLTLAVILLVMVTTLVNLIR